MRNHEHSVITKDYILIEISSDPPLFVTVTGETTPDVRLAERFPDPKSAKKIQRAFEKVPWNKQKYAVAHLTQVTAYKVEWDGKD